MISVFVELYKMAASSEERMSPEAEMLYKKMGQKRYEKLVDDMQSIADRFKERSGRYQGVIREPPTPSTEVSALQAPFIFK